MPAAALSYLSFPSPLGWILIAAKLDGLCLLHIFSGEAPDERALRDFLQREYPNSSMERDDRSPMLLKAREAVLRYLESGAPLPDLPLNLEKGTPFQRDVWRAMCEIPPGETRSYQQIAERIGRPRATRAVGQACGKNPVAILVPCHRVVASGGKLGGYSGGLHIKRALLDLEGDTLHDPGP